MIVPLIKVYALRLGAVFETALTRRRGIVLDHISKSEGVEVGFDNGVTKILHGDIKVRPVELVH